MNDYRPLADRLRPKTLDEVVGQEHLVGPSGVMRKMLASGFLPSMILWGPPGSGKTTIAHLLASLTNAHVVGSSAVTSSLRDVRAAIREAKARLAASKQRTVFFLDEMHRFNKAQQDALLPHVEDGTVIFIGATTENPSFEIIAPLLSRCRVFVLKPLSRECLNTIIDRGLRTVKRSITEEARTLLIESANGDARALLTTIEVAASLSKTGTLSGEHIEEAAQKRALQYDRAGEEHHNTISAFIKSMRAGDVDAALYYLARMVAAGEDPLVIARRMVVFASEDVEAPTALVVANAVFDACHKIGYPECQENLAAGVVYLARAKKDRSAYDAYFAALDDVKKYGNLPIPLSIRNAPTALMKALGYGKGYRPYATESLLPDKIKGKTYYGKR